MIAENTKQILSPVNEYLPLVWKIILIVFLLYIFYSITGVFLRFLARKIKKSAKSRDCSFSWISCDEVRNAIQDFKKKEMYKSIKHHNDNDYSRR